MKILNSCYLILLLLFKNADSNSDLVLLDCCTNGEFKRWLGYLEPIIIVFL